MSRSVAGCSITPPSPQAPPAPVLREMPPRAKPLPALGSAPQGPRGGAAGIPSPRLHPLQHGAAGMGPRPAGSTGVCRGLPDPGPRAGGKGGGGELLPGQRCLPLGGAPRPVLPRANPWASTIAVAETCCFLPGASLSQAIAEVDTPPPVTFILLHDVTDAIPATAVAARCANHLNRRPSDTPRTRSGRHRRP